MLARLLLAAILVFAFDLASAKRLYKYQDENGVWHYTDIRPATDREVESKLVKVEPELPVSVRRLGDHAKARYQFTNLLDGPIQVGVDWAKRENVTSTPPLPGWFVIEARQSLDLFSVSPIDPTQGWEFQLSYRYVPGEPRAEHSSQIQYLPPFPSGQRFYIGQAFRGKFSHNRPESRFAVDITLPEGTPVLAARSGIVMAVDDDFFGAGLDADKYAERANTVRILHEDGTMAVYAHLQVDSVGVATGQAVLEGEQLALSGNTGYSSGPHLHFAIQRNAGARLESIPFVFRNKRGDSVEPKAGSWLRR